jgi:cysteine desulfurase
MEAYLDNAATTRCFPAVARLMTQIAENDYGNPSALHQKGVEAERYLREARASVAHLLDVREKEIVFTSGGTEADNLAIVGAARAYARSGKHIVTTAIEHPAVAEAVKYLAGEGFEVTYLPVDKNGAISLAALAEALRPDTTLVSIMHTNNEIGAVQPIAEAGALIRKTNPQTVFHVDAVQGLGFFHFYPKRMNIDLLAASAHKIHGPKGAGFLYVGERVKLQPLSYGGGQQRGLRHGTENVPAIAGFAKALEILDSDFAAGVQRVQELRAHFVAGLEALAEVAVNGGEAPHIVSATVAGVKSEVLLHALEEKGVYIATGSACASNVAKKQSATLKAIGLSKEAAEQTIRLSFSRFTTIEELDFALQAMSEIIPVLRRYVRR